MAIEIKRQFAPGLDREQAMEQARLLHALADPTRLLILSVLGRHGGMVCVNEMVESLENWNQPTISHHLATLKSAGLVTCRKKGLCGYYRLCPDRFRDAQALIGALVGKEVK